MQHVHRTLGAHHRDLGRRPGVGIGPNVLARHHAVRTAIRLARDDRHLRHSRLREREQQLRAVPITPPYSCPVPGRKPGTSSKVTSGMLNASQNLTARTLHRRVDVERASQMRRLIRHHANRAAGDAGEADDQVPGEVLLHLQQVSLVHDVANHLHHVVGLIRHRRHDRLEDLFRAVGGSAASR